MKKFSKLIPLVLVTTLMLTACGAKAGGKDEKGVEKTSTQSKESDYELNVGYNPGTGNILGFIAAEKGIAKEEGIKMNFVPFSNSTDALNALNAGKIDIGASFGTAAPLTFITKGADFTMIGGYLSGGMPIYANPNFEYDRLQSFKGKKVATARMYTPDIVWRGAMMDAGYDLEKDVEIMEFKKPTEVLEAVKSGKADVGIGTNSTYMQSKEAGLKTVAWSNELWDPVHVCCRPVALTKEVKENPNAYKAFIKSFIRAQKVLEEDPEYAVKLNMKYLKLDEEKARTMLLETNQIIEADPKSDGIKHMWQKLIDMKYVDPGDINVEDHINIKLYKEALDELTNSYPDDAFYKKLQKKYTEYNSQILGKTE